MNILIVTGIFPPDIGGPATYVPMIAAGLVSRGHGVRVLTWSDDPGSRDDAYPYQVVRISRTSSRSLRWFKTAAMIARLGAGSDVLFVCGLALYAALANALIRRPLAMRIVGDLAWERSMNRGCEQDFETFQHARHPLRTRLLQSLQNWWLHRADVIIVPSRYLCQWVAAQKVGEERITVIPNAVERDETVEPLEIPLETSVNLITAGRLIGLKRVDGIIAALAELEATGLVVVGDGPERPALERLAARLCVRDRVFFAGRQDNRGLRRLMKASDIFVLNSVHEGFPFVLLEAMSMGLPLVANAVGGIPEILDHDGNGLLVDGSNGNLVAALRRLAQSADLRVRLGRNAYDQVWSRFGAPAMLDRTEALLTRMRNSEVR